MVKSRDIKPEPRKMAAISEPVCIDKGWLLLFFILALAARFIALGKAELWQDEMLFVSTSNLSLTLWQVISNYWGRYIVGMAWLPLPAVIQNIYMRGINSWVPDIMHNPFFVRLPGVVFGSFSVLWVYLLGNKFFRKEVAIGASLMMCLFLFPVFYSREAHAYPSLLFLSSLTLYLFFLVLFGEHLSWKRLLLLLLTLIGLTYCHLAGTMLLAALSLSAFIWWLVFRFVANDRVKSSNTFKIGLVCAVAVLLICPVFAKILTQSNPHLAAKSHLPYYIIVNDGISKLFLGEHIWACVVAWLIFFCGVISLLKRDAHEYERRTYVFIVLSTITFIALSTHRTQYTSARYFSPIAPACYLVFAQGLYEVSRFPSIIRKEWERHSKKIFAVLVAVLLVIHAAIFLPPLYRLTHKSVDFGSIAKWLNANLKPGTPYLMESGYELRFVGGYFPTPGLIPACPYIHGTGPGEVLRLHDRQKEFMLHFPEAPFIESAHHEFGTPQGVWKWPHQHFKRKVTLKNDALRNIIGFGIYPIEPYCKVSEVSYITYIFFNTNEDIENFARESGQSILFTYPGWQCVQVQQGVYMRFVNRRRATIMIKNLINRPTAGNIILQGTIAGAAQRYVIDIRIDGKSIGQHSVRGGQLWTLQADEVILDVGEHTLDWSVNRTGVAHIAGLLLNEIRFVSNPE